MTAIRAERALLATLDGDCKTPLSAYATLDGSQLSLRAQWFDNGQLHHAAATAEASQAQALGVQLGEELKQQANAA